MILCETPVRFHFFSLLILLLKQEDLFVAACRNFMFISSSFQTGTSRPFHPYVHPLRDPDHEDHDVLH